jgi:hypothetical protein
MGKLGTQQGFVTDFTSTLQVNPITVTLRSDVKPMLWCITAIEDPRANSTGRRNTLNKDVTMKAHKRRSNRSTRSKLYSPKQAASLAA